MVENKQERDCTIQINTVIDGRETQTVREGTMRTDGSAITLFYREESAETVLVLQKSGVKIQRIGDYGLSLSLQEQAVNDGALELGNAQGKIRTHAHKIRYTMEKGAVLAILHYDLIIADERQETKIRLYAKMK